MHCRGVCRALLRANWPGLQSYAQRERPKIVLWLVWLVLRCQLHSDSCCHGLVLSERILGFEQVRITEQSPSEQFEDHFVNFRI